MKPITLLAPSILLALGPVAFGFGFRINEMDAAATARGDAFTATADNPSAVYYNPAGITQLDGLTSRITGYGINLKSEYTSPDGESLSSHNNLHAVPATFITYKQEGSPVAFGFGSYSPFGLGLKYPDSAPFRTVARDGSISYMTFNPVVAVQISRTFSAGAGVTINYGKTTLQRGIMEQGDNFRFDGSGLAWGFNAGLLWQPTPQHSFGLRYQSSTEIDFSGHSKVTLSDSQRATIRKANAAIRTIRKQLAPYGEEAIDNALLSYGLPLEEMPERYPLERANAKLRFPQIVTAAYSYRPKPDWNIEFDIDWTDWDCLNTAVLHKQESGDADIPFNYTSSFIYCLGVTKEFSHGLHASCGYIYSENSIHSGDFSPANPDGVRHVFSTGVGQKISRYSWDLAYQYSYAPKRTITNGTLADGTYEFSTHAITLSVGVEL
jgi:long-chain fatty acid transport protein